MIYRYETLDAASVFASCNVYPIIGTGTLCVQSRLLQALLKRAASRLLQTYALRVNQQVHAGSLALRGFSCCR